MAWRTDRGPPSHANVKKDNYLLTATFDPSFISPLNLFQPQRPTASSLSFRLKQRKQMRSSFAWPVTQHHKNPLVFLSHLDPPESGLCPTLGPSPSIAPWHRLQRAAPSRWAGPSSNHLVQLFTEWTHPFVIQPFTFIQMCPNKLQNKIKRELFFTTKANGPKLSQPVKQCESAVGL